LPRLGMLATAVDAESDTDAGKGTADALSKGRVTLPAPTTEEERRARDLGVAQDLGWFPAPLRIATLGHPTETLGGSQEGDAGADTTAAAGSRATAPTDQRARE
jgi:hypothetical protein